MKIYQPMLFVGLGGTGCLIGAELERRLRAELCGPGGTDLQEVMSGGNFLPYQLPACLQFVYADLNEAELSRMHRSVVPAEDHVPAAARTSHLVGDLVPQHDTYPQVARSLRVNAGDLVADWLPPPAWEPRVSPLIRGAGQLPTVGRATLFETFRHGLGSVQRPLADAIGRLTTSGGDMQKLGGRMRNTCDVFVAFSVAGGTGCGIFYDYLHLIEDAFVRAGVKAQIYPLVVMPSAFDEGMGGGRVARLNAGRALLDLFRLVDDQNGQAAGTNLDDIGQVGAVAVHYPGNRVIRMRASTVQTAFLFSRPPGVDRDDLHRSIVSLLLSLVGTDQDEPTEQVRVNERTYQSFADYFINKAVEREVMAESGIGSCGVSTSLVASMTVPVEELADAVSSRLLAAAVTELTVPPPGTAEVNRPLIDRAFSAAMIGPIRSRTALDFAEPGTAKGAEAIRSALANRARSMDASLTALDGHLADQVPQLARDFDPRRATEHLLAEVNLFRLHRVLVGHPQFGDSAERQGFLGLIENRRQEPKAPAGITVTPPRTSGVTNRLLGRARWTDPEVRDALRQQDTWYQWRARRSWHLRWSEQTRQWEPKASRLRRQLQATVDAFNDHARSEPARFAHRARDLYRPRVGVSYLLPPQGDDLEPFYRQVVRRFVDIYSARGLLRPTATEGEIVDTVLGPEIWQHAVLAGLDQGPGQAVALVRDRLKQEVHRLFRHSGPDQEPLLPELGELLAATAGRDGVRLSDGDLAQFRRKIAALVPGGFSPQGSGELRILISYPGSSKDPNAEKFLRDELNLPRASRVTIEYRPIESESIVVVLFRTSMSVTEVRELREVLRQWSDAVRASASADFLRWRQRLGYDFGYLATTEEHRVQILHRLLCSLWNGQISHPAGDSPDSPEEIVVRLGAQEKASMMLRLTPYAGTSSWGSLLHAYEEWTIADDEQIRRDFCRQLMATLPVGLEATPRRPSDLYRRLLKIAEQQSVLLGERVLEIPEDSRAHVETLHRFWSQTFPAALDLPFNATARPVRSTLRELEGAAQA